MSEEKKEQKKEEIELFSVEDDALEDAAGGGAVKGPDALPVHLDIPQAVHAGGGKLWGYEVTKYYQ